MGNQYVVVLSFDGQADVETVPFGAESCGIGIGLEGVTDCESAEAVISVDGDGVVIASKGTSQVIVNRNGRHRLLESGRSISLLMGDVVSIGEASQHCVEVKKVYRLEKPLVSRATRNVLVAGGAVMVMALMPACFPQQTAGMPMDPPNMEQDQENEAKPTDDSAEKTPAADSKEEQTDTDKKDGEQNLDGSSSQ